MKFRITILTLLSCLLAGCGSKTAMTINNEIVSLGEYAVFTRFVQANQYTAYQSAYRDYLKQSGQTDVDDAIMSTIWNTPVNKTSENGSDTSQNKSNSNSSNVGSLNISTPSEAIVERTEGDALKVMAIESFKEFIITSSHAKDYNINLDDSDLSFINKMANDYYNQNKTAMSYDNVSLNDVISFMKHYYLFVKTVNHIHSKTITTVTDAESRVINISYMAVPYDSDENSVKGLMYQIYNDIKTNNESLEDMAKQYNAVYKTIDITPLDKSADYVFSDKDLDLISKSYNNDILEPIKGDNNIYYIIKINQVDKPDESLKYRNELIVKYKMQVYIDLYNSWLAQANIVYNSKVLNDFKVTDSVIFKAVD